MFFDHAGVRVHYEVTGEGEPVLLLHGWGGKIESFLPLVRDLSKSRQVIALDAPGHGESGEPQDVWGVSDYAEVALALLSRLNIGKTDIVAHSFGGRVALLLSSEHPERVRRMVLTGCAGIPKKSASRAMKKKLFGAVKALAETDFAQRSGLRETMVRLFGSADYRTLSPAMRKTFSRVIGQDLTACLSRISCPVVLFWGTEDGETPIWMGEIMEREIPDAALIRAEGAGHFAYLDQYPRFRAVVQSFLK